MIPAEKTLNIPIAKPFIGEAEKQAVMEVLNSGQLAQGAKVKAFEEKFAVTRSLHRCDSRERRLAGHEARPA